MGSYLAILSARFRMLLQYRAAALAGVATQVFWGLIRIMIFEGFYRSTTQVQPMTLAQTVSYLWLGQAMLGLTLWSTDADNTAAFCAGQPRPAAAAEGLEGPAQARAR